MSSKRNLFLLGVFFSFLFFSCESTDPVEPTFEVEQSVINIGATNATLLFNTQEDLSLFDEFGFLLSQEKEINLENARKLPFESKVGSQLQLVVDSLEAEQTYFFGFYTQKGESTNIYETASFTTFKSNSWIKRSTHPAAQNMGNFFHSFQAGDHIYVGWGTSTSDVFLKTLYEFNPKNSQWIKKGNIPDELYPGIYLNASELTDGEALVYSSDDKSKTNYAYTYDSNDDSWSAANLISDTLYYKMRYSSNLFSYGGEAYLIGPGSKRTGEYFGGLYQKIYHYNMTAAIWEIVVEHDELALIYPITAKVGNYVYIFSEDIRNEIHRIDISTGETLVNFTAVPTNNYRIYAMQPWQNGFTVALENEIHYYNAVENNWTTLLADEPFVNTNFRLFNINEKLYGFSEFDNSIYEYLP